MIEHNFFNPVQVRGRFPVFKKGIFLRTCFLKKIFSHFDRSIFSFKEGCRIGVHPKFLTRYLGKDFLPKDPVLTLTAVVKEQAACIVDTCDENHCNIVPFRKVGYFVYYNKILAANACFLKKEEAGKRLFG